MEENQYDRYYENGETPLTRAAKDGDLQKVNELIKAGANVNFREPPDMTYYSALHQASARGHLEIVKVLIAAGAEIDPYCQYFGGGTPLHRACMGGHLEIVQYLLEHGANINAKDLQENTPLSIAQLYERAAVIEFLSTTAGPALQRFHQPANKWEGPEPDIEKLIAEKDIRGLVGALHYSDWEINEAAICALVQIGPPAVMHLVAAIEEYMASSKDNDMYAHIRVLEALGRIGDSRAVEHLIPMLKDKDADVRKIIETLGKIGDSRAVEHLIPMLKDEDADLRAEAAYALGKIGDSRAVECLIPMLKDQETEVRSSAVDALAEIGDSRAVEHLIPMLKDEDAYVRTEASIALEKIGWQPGKDNNYR